MKSLELFAGAGGLALGATLENFHHAAVIEWDSHSCRNIRANQKRGYEAVSSWPVIESDVRDIDFKKWEGKLDLVSGGPPCQPFSIGGKHKGNKDDRNMFPQAVRAIRDIRPKAFVFENVKGLLRESFASYFNYIVLQLTYPTVTRRGSEPWEDHLSRLERLHTGGKFPDLSYRVTYRLLNAANYGIPQRRERTFIVGIRADLDREWSFPEPTHSREALINDQWKTGRYWERHKVSRREVSRIASTLAGPPSRQDVKQNVLPWRTVRDAIGDLEKPARNPESARIPNHVLQQGARAYPGHTGSPLDAPAKTLKAGDHGVPGGENMLRLSDGSVRYFTVRESARLQTFPDPYFFAGSWTENMRQLGNAVPVELARVVLRQLHRTL